MTHVTPVEKGLMALGALTFLAVCFLIVLAAAYFIAMWWTAKTRFDDEPSSTFMQRTKLP